MARPNEESEVIGHYLVPARGRPAQPLLHESTSLFQDVVSDKLSTVEAAIEADIGKLNQFFLILHWASDVKGGTGSCVDKGGEALDANGAAAKTSVTVKQRTLLMIAAHAGSLRVLAYLLARGAEPSRKSPDGITAYDLAVAGESAQAATALAMMRDADSHPPSSTRSSSTTETQSFSGTDAMRGSARQDLSESEGSSYSTTDLTRPEYSTDDFRMFNFKVLRCSKRHAHDWRACPFAHPTENARRRDPREFKYCALACPDYKQGFCIRGDVCPYSHGVFECWLHPSRYRTQLCKDGANCHRPVCFFAHSLPELRAPTYTWVPTPADLAKQPAAAAAAANNNTAAAAAAAAGGGGGTLQAAASMPTAAAAHAFGGGSGGNADLSAAAGSPMAVVAGPDGRLLSTASSGIPPMSISSDGTSSGMGPSCGSPRTGFSSGSSGMLQLMALAGGCGGSGGVPGVLATLSGGTAAASGGGGTNGSSSCSSGANGSPSPSCSVGSKDCCNSNGNANGGANGILAAVQAAGNGGKDGKGGHLNGINGASAGNGSAAAGAGGKGTQNLTQPNAAASMLGFTAPRMSNAFARRHGLNPKDNPMINLQKIALQSQQQQQQGQQPQQQQQASALGAITPAAGGHLGVTGSYSEGAANAAVTAAALRSQQAVAAAGNGLTLLHNATSCGGAEGLARTASMSGSGDRHQQQRLQQAAAAAAAAAANGSTSQSAYSSMSLVGPGAASAFGVGPGGMMPAGMVGNMGPMNAAAMQQQMQQMQQMQQAAAVHLGAAAGGSPDSSLLAAQLAANIQQLNIQQQQQQQQRHQQHLGIGLGIGGMNMAGGAAAAAAAAAAAGIGHGPAVHAMQYMASASPSPHHALLHTGMYGSGPGVGMYDTAQQHMMVAISGAQAEV